MVGLALIDRAAIAAAFIAIITVTPAAVPASAQANPDYAALVAAPDRSDADRESDKRRDPVPFLAFAGLRPGMKVLDMGAGGGYSTELDARAVAPTGTAYGQNPPGMFERAVAALGERLKKGKIRVREIIKDAGDEASAEEVEEESLAEIAVLGRVERFANGPDQRRPFPG